MGHLPSTTPLLHSTHTDSPLCLQDISPRLTPPTPSPDGNPTHPPGNPARAAAISRPNTHRLQEPPSPSSAVQPSPTLAFLAETFTVTRNSLQLNCDLVQDLSPHALQTITAGEGPILSILYTTVSGIVAITTQLETVNTQLSEIHKENQELRSNLHDLTSKITNELALYEDIRPLQSALRDLSHRVTTTAPMACPTATTSHPTAPMAPHNAPLQEVSQPTLPNQLALPPNPVPPLMPPHWPDWPPPHLRKTSTPSSTASSMTPRSRRCSATTTCTPRPSHSLQRRNSFVSTNMTCRFLPLPPSTRTMPREPQQPPPMRKRPAPAQEIGKRKQKKPRLQRLREMGTRR